MKLVKWDKSLSRKFFPAISHSSKSIFMVWNILKKNPWNWLCTNIIWFFESMYLKNPFLFFLGKSTLMDSLFNTNFESIPQNHREPNVRLDSHTYELEESNVKLKLSICDTVGYGDQVNKQDRYVFVYYYYFCITKKFMKWINCVEFEIIDFFSFKPIVDHIDAQFEAFLQEELKIKRNLNTYHDSR